MRKLLALVPILLLAGCSGGKPTIADLNTHFDRCLSGKQSIVETQQAIEAFSNAGEDGKHFLTQKIKSPVEEERWLVAFFMFEAPSLILPKAEMETWLANEKSQNVRNKVQDAMRKAGY